MSPWSMAATPMFSPDRSDVHQKLICLFEGEVLFHDPAFAGIIGSRPRRGTCGIERFVDVVD
jgi:hypothetical protein